jgi:hypothetical protein
LACIGLHWPLLAINDCCWQAVGHGRSVVMVVVGDVDCW